MKLGIFTKESLLRVLKGRELVILMEIGQRNGDTPPGLKVELVDIQKQIYIIKKNDK